MRSHLHRPLAAATIAAALALPAVPTTAATVALEDFDGGAVNLVSSSVPSLDGGAGDWFGVGQLGAWPQGIPPGVPFSLADDSASDVSTQGANPAFPADLEGVFGQNRDIDDAFLGLADTQEWSAGELTASWTFDISGQSELELAIDLGAQADGASFGGFGPDTLVTFDYQIDAGPAGNAFTVAPNASFGAFGYRAMDDGDVPTVGANGPLEATGDNPVTKLLAESGSAAADTFLDKTPASGPAAGAMDTFATAINGTGSQLTLTMVANVPFEAMAIDNIAIQGVPEPASAVLFGLGAAVLLVRCRAAARSAVAQ